MNTQKQIYSQNWLKFIIGWVIVFAIRMVPFRPANVEPVLATQMPFSKRYGMIAGFVFAFLNILVYDAFTSGVGSWTWLVAITYGAIGVLAGWWFSKRKGNVANYALFAIVATLLFDLITGVLAGPLLFGQSFMSAFVGQIPFTLRHLIGNTIFAAVASPLIDRWVVKNKKFETKVLFGKLAKQG